MTLTRYTRVFWGVLIAAALAACGGGVNGGSSTAGLNPTVQAAHQQPDRERAKRKGKLVIELRIPRKKHHGRRIRPGYISASTQSMVISVPGQSNQVFNVTPGSPGCSTTSGYVTCDVSGFFTAGEQTITITLYDQTGGQGNVLSTGTTTATILTGSVTYISITLEGTVASASVRVNGSTAVSIPVGTPTSLPLTINAYDADGNLIIAPGGYDSSTPVQIVDSDTSGVTTLSPSTIGGPDTTATLSYNGGYLSSAVITAKVGGIAQANPVTVTIAATPSPTPSPTPMPQVSPSSLTFSSGATQTFTVLESNYTGALTASSGSTGVATVSPASANGPNATFTVKPIAGGTTAITVTDSFGNNVTVNVSVNGGVIVIDQVPAANPTSLTFYTAASQTFDVKETDYYGAFTESDNCGGIATTSPSSASGPKATFTVTPGNGGTCTVTITDGQGNTTGVGISVSGANITINNRHGKRPVHGGE